MCYVGGAKGEMRYLGRKKERGKKCDDGGRRREGDSSRGRVGVRMFVDLVVVCEKEFRWKSDLSNRF